MIKDDEIFINLDNSKEFFNFQPDRGQETRTLKIKNKNEIKNNKNCDFVEENNFNQEQNEYRSNLGENKNTIYIEDDQSMLEKVSSICEDTLQGVSLIKDVFKTVFSNP